MNRIRISADSLCDLSPALLKQYDITLLPLKVSLGGKDYLDGVEITPDELLETAEKTGSIGATSAPNLGEYLDFFHSTLEGADALIHLTVNPKLSSACQNAFLAASEIEQVYVVDTRSLTSGMGILAILAREMADGGAQPTEIVAHLEEIKGKLDVSFVLNTLEYLKRGGRCSALAALGANLLKLKPSIKVNDGLLQLDKKYRGSQEKVLQEYVRDRLADPSSVDDRLVFITHSGLSDHLLEVMRSTVLECVPFKEVQFVRAGCVISNHCGPGCAGIIFLHK